MIDRMKVEWKHNSKINKKLEEKWLENSRECKNRCGYKTCFSVFQFRVPFRQTL